MKLTLSLCAGAMALSLVVSAQNDQNTATIDAAIQEFSSSVAGNGNARAVGSFTNFHAEKENTKGTRYFFRDWVKGTVVTQQNAQVAKDNLLFNYDKITHDLYLTDKASVIQVDQGQVKSFTLNQGGQEYRFRRLDFVLPNVFFLELASSKDSSSGYAFYKLTKTTLKKADFHSDGMVESGNNYDEYIDDVTYYVVNMKTKAVQKIDLKKKSIRDAFGGEKDQFDTYMKKHKSDEIDEAFVSGLVVFLNGL